jgi:hypothetical protein
MTGAIHADMDKARQEAAALADCLDGIASPGRGPMEQDTLRGLSLLARHIVTDIDDALREVEASDGEPPGKPGGRVTEILRSEAGPGRRKHVHGYTFP